MPTKLGGGAGGLPINSIVPMNAFEVIFTEENGNTWLRSGTISNDLNDYPLAARNVGAFFNTFFSFSNETPEAYSCVRTANYFWLITDGNSEAFQYLPDGTYNNLTVDIISIGRPMFDVDWDGTHVWAVGTKNNSTRHLYKLNEADLSVVAEFDLGGTVASDGRSLAVNGDDVWIFQYGGTVHKFDKSGVFQNVSKTLEAGTFTSSNANFIAFYENSFWVLDTVAAKVFQYDLEWNYTGIFFQIAETSSLTNPRGMTVDGEHIWIIGLDLKLLSRFEKYIGMVYRKDDSDSEKPLYVRVA